MTEPGRLRGSARQDFANDDRPDPSSKRVCETADIFPWSRERPHRFPQAPLITQRTVRRTNQIAKEQRRERLPVRQSYRPRAACQRCSGENFSARWIFPKLRVRFALGDGGFSGAGERNVPDSRVKWYADGTRRDAKVGYPNTSTQRKQVDLSRLISIQAFEVATLARAWGRDSQNHRLATVATFRHLAEVLRRFNPLACTSSLYDNAFEPG